MYYGLNLRGTRSFWKQRSCELVQMCRQLGSPTAFFTLSAADYHWPDLFRLLAPNSQPEQLDGRTRRNLMHENPLIVGWFFEQRCQTFIKTFLTRFFDVKDFWYRFEWQHRGSPHIHGLLWLRDAPDVEDISAMSAEQRDAIVAYFDQLVSATIGTEYNISADANPCRKSFSDLTDDEKATDLDKLLSCVQRHTRCGTHCLRKKRGSRRFTCRYGFPITCEDTSNLRYELGRWTFHPKRNDIFIQRHNKFVSQVWRGNTDFSAITSHDAVINYISKYASKGEYQSEAYSEILRRLASRAAPASDAASLIRSLLISSVAERNYSAQEVAHLIMGWPLYHASRSFIVLSLRDDWRRIDNPRNTSLLSHYGSRGDDLRTESLYTFAKRFRWNGHACVPRAKEVIVRVLPYIKLSDDGANNEEYYMYECKLHIPWRGTFPANPPNGLFWQDWYNSHRLYMAGDDPFAEPFRNESYVSGESTIQRVRPLAVPFENMSVGQKSVIALVADQIQNPSNPVRRALVQGKAGTGKSAVIMAICQMLDNAFGESVPSYRVMAPTGAAALNIDGSTIHSMLKIPINGPITPLNGEPLRSLQLNFRQVKFIIIDEYSMIGLRMLHRIHYRLCEASGSNDRPFGNYYIYFFGDIRQLPPVLDTALYLTPNDDFSTQGRRLLNTMHRRFLLSTVHRQLPQEQSFKKALDEIARGTPTRESWELLMTRRQSVNGADRDRFSNAVWLFPENKAVNERNESILAAIGVRISVL